MSEFNDWWSRLIGLEIRGGHMADNLSGIEDRVKNLEHIASSATPTDGFTKQEALDAITRGVEKAFRRALGETDYNAHLWTERFKSEALHAIERGAEKAIAKKENKG